MKVEFANCGLKIEFKEKPETSFLEGGIKPKTSKIQNIFLDPGLRDRAHSIFQKFLNRRGGDSVIPRYD